jgi:hypothetical protein
MREQSSLWRAGKNEKRSAASLLRACILVQHPPQEAWAAERNTNSPSRYEEHQPRPSAWVFSFRAEPSSLERRLKMKKPKAAQLPRVGVPRKASPFRNHGPLRGPLIPPRNSLSSNQPRAARGQHPTKPNYFFFFEPLVSGFLCFMAIFILSF